MIKSVIYDGTGSDAKARIDDEGQLNVIVHQHPPVSDTKPAIPFREFFKNACCSSDMKVNGACVSVDFTIEADPEQDIYIKAVSVVIADGTAVLNQFGAVTALTTGLDFEWSTTDLGVTTIGDGLKTNFDFIRLALGYPGFGDGTAVFRASNVSSPPSSSEAYIPIIDFSQMFGLQYGLKLRRGSTDKLIFRINDDVTGVDQFDAIAYGIKVQ